MDYVSLIRFADSLERSKFGRVLLKVTLKSRFGCWAACVVSAGLPADERRLAVEALQRFLAKKDARRKFINAARKGYRKNPTLARLDTLALALVYSEFLLEANSLFDSKEVRAAILDEAEDSNLIGAGLSLYFELARYRKAVDTMRIGVLRTPAIFRSRADYLKCAFAAAKIREPEQALEFFGRQYQLINDGSNTPCDAERKKLVRCLFEGVFATIAGKIEYERYASRKQTRIGVFFLSSTEALGHAVLDPYYFIALNKQKFDRLIFIGPPRSAYRTASASCLRIIEEYGDYVETSSDILMNLSWMNLGRFTLGPVTLVVDFYWSLLRTVVHRTRDRSDQFQHNSWHLSLPRYFASIGEKFCKKAGIDLDLPIVVLHVRDSGYHRIVKQSYRDSSVRDYSGAVEHLLDAGYQVIRIGDEGMPRLKLAQDRYFELPFIDGYCHELDPFLISRASFMIGCQSGPCSFARAMGVPLLTVNAVLHYTLLPTPMEMACFKRYFRDADGEERELDLEAALAAGVHHFENSYQFEEAGIRVENATPQEILASVKDMIAWLENPGTADTDHQASFRAIVEQTARGLEKKGKDLELPIGDFLGISLPGYRISPTVADLRAGAAVKSDPAGVRQALRMTSSFVK